MSLGLVHIYSGNGKGKTTSAVGLAVRALGQGLKVGYAYFHKNPEKYGYTEIASLEKLGAQIFGFAKQHSFCDKESHRDEISAEVNAGIDFLTELAHKEHFDLLIMDEANITVRDNYLEESRLIEFIKNKPAKMELVITGRGVTPNVIELADYVSIIDKVKHPYDKAILGRKGIEF